MRKVESQKTELKDCEESMKKREVGESRPNGKKLFVAISSSNIGLIY